MRTLVAAPSPDLAPFVRRYCIYDESNPSGMTVPASGRSFMLIHFGDDLLAMIERTRQLPGPTLLSGPPTKPFVVRPLGASLRFVAVEFTDVGLFSLFGDVASALSDSVRPLHGFADRRACSVLSDAVTELASNRQRIHEIEVFLRRYLPTRTYAASRCVARFCAAADAAPRKRVGELSADVGVSTTLLRRHVGRVCGISPKALLDSRRLGVALTTLYDDPHQSVTALAHQLDYFDLSHFSRAFKRYAGHAPSSLPTARFQLARALM